MASQCIFLLADAPRCTPLFFQALKILPVTFFKSGDNIVHVGDGHLELHTRLFVPRARHAFQLPTKSMTVVYLVRHALAQHNTAGNYTIPDAPLTQGGREQAACLNRITKENIQQTAKLIVTSPLTRTLQTTIIGFPELRARLEAQEEPKGIIVLSRLQETAAYPCDTGRPREELESIEEFSGIDFSLLEDDWTSKKGDFDPEVQSVRERAKWVRKWLRARSEKEIVVVAHGGILAKISGSSGWKNCEVRQYTFKSADDEEADIIPINEEHWFSM